MDKKKLNEEIVLCRSVVKRAKVCVIRKLIKKIKLLRSCKKEELREKKLRKGRRLAAEVHMMKTLRPDYVTKFALLTENYVPTGSNTKLKRKRNACAKLVKHKDLVVKINFIRDKFSNWQEELPILLKSSKRKKIEDKEANTENNETNNFDESEKIIVNKEELINDRLDGSKDEEPQAKNEVTKTRKKEVTKTKPKTESSKIGNAKKKIKKKKDDDDVDEDDDVIKNHLDSESVEEKIDDPFFIGKKVIVPRLLQKGSENHPENEIKGTKQKVCKDGSDFKQHCENESDSSRKHLNRKPMESITDELHPSWKAKKIQMIKPFEGKKIKFE